MSEDQANDEGNNCPRCGPNRCTENCTIMRLRDERDRLANCLSEMVKLVDDFMPNVGRCTIQNYRRLNDAPIEARRLLAALTPAGGGTNETSI